MTNEQVLGAFKSHLLMEDAPSPLLSLVTKMEANFQEGGCFERHRKSKSDKAYYLWLVGLTDDMRVADVVSIADFACDNGINPYENCDSLFSIIYDSIYGLINFLVPETKGE